MGYTHIELMGVAEHPFDGSWGYQVVGLLRADVARTGRRRISWPSSTSCHQAGIGVIIDWVPAHFPKDAHGLAEFDGTALYEHADPRLGEHMRLGHEDLQLRPARGENFLVANALYWMERYHVDGLRVDAVASMLYLDYSRKAGRVAAQPVRRPRKSRGDRVPARVQHGRASRAPGRADDRRGVDRVPRRDAARAPRRPGILSSSGTWAG